MDIYPELKTRKIIILLMLVYTIWSILFIMRSSSIAVDGKRYFSLFDDAMISMRYAWNLSHGNGLVWNPGERVEGYTNLLMTLIMSAYTGIFEKSDAVLAVQITGLAFVFGISFLVWRLCSFFAEEIKGNTRSSYKTIVLVMFLTYYPLSYWSLMGMETGLLTLMVVASLYVTELYLLRKQWGHLFIVAGLLGLAYLTRPDAILFSAPIFLYLLHVNNHDPFRCRTKFTEMILPLIFYASFIIGQEVFRIYYYNEYLPNTYYLKLTGMPFLDRINNGMGFIMPYVFTHIFLLGMAIAGYWINPDSRKKFYLILILLPVLYQVWVGGDPWAYWRILAPVQPILAILFVLSTYKILQKAGGKIHSKLRSRIVYYIIALGILLSNLTFVGEMLLIRKPYQTEAFESLINTAIIIDEVTTQDSTVGVYWAGIIPYYSGRKAVDFLGKSDKYIARLQPDLSGMVSWSGMYSVPGHNKYDLNYSIKYLHPTYIQYPIWKGQNIFSWAIDNYAVVNYKGIQLWFKKEAPEVKWEILDQ